ncbi:hypothetical protein DFH06DRAFT_1237400 [Mycena polygramma]|nr:hypothetical protein DFH06DRAFT_1237400 [Mycena polygramma]
MRLMYHEQVRSFVRNNRDILLSRATMEICFSYPPFKHVSPATKLLILKELNGRVESVGDAAIVAQSLDSAWDVVTQLLHSADARMRQYTCQLLGTLAPSYDSTSSRLEACVQLASRDDATVVQSAAEGRDGVQAVADIEIWEYIPEYLDSWNSHAAYTLSKISRCPDGVRPILHAIGSEDLTYLVNSPDVETRRWTRSFLRKVAHHEFPNWTKQFVRYSEPLSAQILNRAYRFNCRRDKT